jgi:peptidoglycan/LPS O-acetylase OafA/YrhL
MITEKLEPVHEKIDVARDKIEAAQEKIAELEKKHLAQLRELETSHVIRLKQLDGLRGILIIVIVLFHTTPFAYLPTCLTEDYTDSLCKASFYSPLRFLTNQGNQAVCLFIVLAGFLIPLTVKKVTIKSQGAWLTSRIIRLYLTGIAALIFSLPFWNIAWHLTKDPERFFFQANRRGLLREFIHEASFGFVQHAKVGNASLHLNPPFWYLTMLLFLTAVTPLFLAVLKKMPRKAQLATLVVCVIAASVINENFVPIPFTFLCYLPYYIIGMLIFLLDTHEWKWVIKMKNWQLILIGVVLIEIGGLRDFFHSVSYQTSTIPSLVYIGCSFSLAIGLIIIMVGFLNIHDRKFATSKPLLFFGEYSFSLFLIHVPILSSFNYIMTDRFQHQTFALYILSIVVCVPICILIAVFFRNFVDRPLNKVSVLVENIGQE